jgi:hypothetical protein
VFVTLLSLNTSSVHDLVKGAESQLPRGKRLCSQRHLTKADVMKSAYTNAWTSRGKGFLRCPDTAP